MKTGPHEHPCTHCHVLTECWGDLEPNHDGWPEVVCVEFHIRNSHLLCQTCHELFAAGVCDDCGAWGTEAHEPNCDVAHPTEAA